MSIVRSSNRQRLTLLLWVLVASFYFYLCYDYIRMTSNDREFGDYMHYIVQLAGNDGRSPKEVRELLLVKAEQLSLPVRSDQIVVRGQRNTLNIAVNYDVDIDIPVIQREVYRKKFEHDVKFQIPR
ncbi:MAG TPA: hypothetical protein VKK06_24895 [Terriglobia bacterium]|nr:hypothetical protein [Terriglobia bacterium]